jgi:hypothetical protein
MPIEIKKEIELEIAHVLFINIVGYSKLSISDQHAAVETGAMIKPTPTLPRASKRNSDAPGQDRGLERRPAQIIPRLKEVLAKPDPALGFYNGELRFWLGKPLNRLV